MKKSLTFLLCCACFAANAQVHSIRGVVSSESDGTPVSGVMVLVKGTNTYATTDAGGEYAIPASQGDILVFNLLGYLTKEMAVGASAVIDVALAVDATTIDDLVVVGYGVQKKSVVTAAIGSVKAADLENQTPTRMESMLQGKVAGVNIVRNSGNPDAGVTVRIRGIGTTGNSNPLYVVDGMQMGSDDGLNQINPSDIESIEILKDAASAAVYGTRGANGVILVTTKRGKMGDARVTYDMQYGWQNPAKIRRVLNAEEYRMLMAEGAANSDYDLSNLLLGALDPNFRDGTLYKRYANTDTDWLKELFYRNAPTQNHQISVSGASDRVNYYVSAGYFDQDGIIGGNYGRSNFDRISLRTNTTYKLMDKSASRSFLAKANLGVSAQYAHTNSTGINANGVNGSVLFNAMSIAPIYPVYATTPDQISAITAAAENAGVPLLTDDQGRIFDMADGMGEVTNPIAEFNKPYTTNWGDKFVASFWADLELYRGLTFKSSYGVDMAFWGNNGWGRPFYNGSGRSPSTDSSASAEFNRGFTYQIENTLTYQNTFAGKHNLTVLLGQSARANRNSTKLNGSKKNLSIIDRDKAWIDTATDGTGNVSGGPAAPYRLASYFGRVSYNFDERYMLEFTLRRDGSSRFGANNKWAMFPSVSVGWNIANEKFAENFPSWISALKLRGSWGQNGNDAIANFLYTSDMGYGNSNKYIWGSASDLNVYRVGAQPERIANQDLKWEAAEQIDAGLDASFFGGSLNFSFDWYQKNTKGMLITMSLPEYLGNTLPTGNTGDMFNTGVELELDYRFVRGKWSFGAMFNATYLKNRLENLGTAQGFRNIGFTNDNWGPGNFRRDENGMPFHYFWGKRTGGIFQNQAEIDAYTWTGMAPDPADASKQIQVTRKIQPNAVPGDVKFIDINGDGVIDPADKTMIGNWFPKWSYNFSIDAAWNGIDISMFWQGVANVDIFDFTRRLDRGDLNLPAYFLDRWHGEGTSNTIPRMTTFDSANENYSASDLYVQNGAYLRLRSLQIGYTIPEWVTRKAFVSRLRVYFMAENLLTITKYRGFDPEIGISNDNSGGVDSGMYPVARTLSVGVNLAF